MTYPRPLRSINPPPTREWCGHAGCVCHTVASLRVQTPFPLGYGPPYCCNRCATVEYLCWGTTEGRVIYRRGHLLDMRGSA